MFASLLHIAVPSPRVKNTVPVPLFMITPAVVTVIGHANWRCCPAGTGKLGLGDPEATMADPPKFTKQKSLPALSTTTVSPPAGSATSCEVVLAAADTHPLGLNDWTCPVIGDSCCVVVGVDAAIHGDLQRHVKCLSESKLSLLNWLATPSILELIGFITVKRLLHGFGGARCGPGRTPAATIAVGCTTRPT